MAKLVQVTIVLRFLAYLRNPLTKKPNLAASLEAANLPNTTDQESLLKLYYLALVRIVKKWTMPIHNWREALNRFVIEFGERVPPLD